MNETDHFGEIEALMQEPPGGENYGRRTAMGEPPSAGEPDDRTALENSTRGAQIADFLGDENPGGWTAVQPGRSERSGGLTAHRGILHPDEFVDKSELKRQIERELGFTIAEVKATISGGAGRPPKAKLRLRAAVDAKLLEIANAGGNMEALSRVTGIPYRTIKSALARARAAA